MLWRLQVGSTVALQEEGSGFESLGGGVDLPSMSEWVVFPTGKDLHLEQISDFKLT